MCPANGFTRLYVYLRRGVNVVDGRLPGLQDLSANHPAMLYTILGEDLMHAGYA